MYLCLSSATDNQSGALVTGFVGWSVFLLAFSSTRGLMSYSEESNGWSVENVSPRAVLSYCLASGLFFFLGGVL